MMKHPGLFALLFFLAACAPRSEDETHSPEDEPVPVATGKIAIPASIRANLGITFAKVDVRAVSATIRVPGAFELLPRARREYQVVLPGRIELLVDQYDSIEAGQPLYRFESSAWSELIYEVVLAEQAIETANAEIEVAEARLVEARRKLELARERTDALAQVDFKRADLIADSLELEASLPRLEAESGLAVTRLENAKRTYEHALHHAALASGIPQGDLLAEVSVDGRTVPAYTTMDWITVRAAEPGIVESLALTDGAFVESSTLVLSTADPGRVRFRALALQADLPALVGIDVARIVPPESPGFPVDTGVEAAMNISLEAHPEERTLTLLATPKEQAPWIRPGVSAFLEIVVESTDAAALAIPRSAIVQDGITHVFFRRDPSDPNQAIRVEADLGVSDGRWVAIMSGLMRGDEVVMTGAYELQLAMDQSPSDKSGGHVHADGTSH